ncbi:MAG TPA: tRNA (adenosine(37)-N6)-threonylcarbamoyltransferase complex dimerization subunit type 1 TsaB, partial [Chitinophagaceae bacterium]|nr:tRNA (adenosine(37)-N6)-threonylcarbamoyltransferase complex dimerization subunit type 1 TsaB [Chitinophagaceae bacterium]
MSLILNIDTSTEQASISVAENGQSLCLLTNADQKEHSSWLHVAIKEALQTTSREIKDLAAIAITAGPGSYTGLRVGMATAKGLCYALELPFIAVNTLEAMAAAATGEEADYFCPMIDARRMEVFTALYDKKGNTILPPCAMILENEPFTTYLETGKILFFGNGSEKYRALQQHFNAIFKQLPFTAVNLAGIAHKKYEMADFSPLAYTEPIYIKDFYTPG